MQLKVIGSINYKGAHIGEWGRVCFRQLYCYQFLNYLHDTLTDLQLQNQQDDDPKIVFFGCTEPPIGNPFLHSLDMLSTTTCTLKNIQLWNLTWHAKYPCCHPDVPPCGCMVYIYIKLHEIFEAFALRGQSLAVKTRQRYETWRG